MAWLLASLILMILVQITLANILFQNYSGLPLFIVIQCFRVTHLILMLDKMELGILVFYAPKCISNQTEMTGEGFSVVLNKWFHSFYKYICLSV